MTHTFQNIVLFRGVTVLDNMLRRANIQVKYAAEIEALYAPA